MAACVNGMLISMHNGMLDVMLDDMRNGMVDGMTDGMRQLPPEPDFGFWNVLPEPGNKTPSCALLRQIQS